MAAGGRWDLIRLLRGPIRGQYL